MILLPFTVLALAAAAQVGKGISVSYDDLVEVAGTEYVIATVSRHSKTGGDSRHLLFINTRTSDQHSVTFPYRSYSDKLEQIRIEKLHINLIVTSARTVDANGKNGIDYEDPRQLFAFSPDGRTRTQITGDGFYMSAWQVNKETGRLVITGHQDVNTNGKLDRGDEARVILYDLGTMKPAASN